MNSEKRNPTVGIEQTGDELPGMVQLKLPGNFSHEIQERLKAEKRKYDRERQRAYREKRKNSSAIPVIIETFGFSGFYKSHYVQLNNDANIWDTTPYGWQDYKEAARLLFNGYAPDVWALLFLVVVGVSREAPSAALPLITYFKRAYSKRVFINGQDVGEVGFSEQSNGAG